MWSVVLNDSWNCTLIFAQLLRKNNLAQVFSLNSPQIVESGDAFLIISSFLVVENHLPIEQCWEVKLHSRENLRHLKLRRLTSRENMFCASTFTCTCRCNRRPVLHCASLLRTIFAPLARARAHVKSLRGRTLTTSPLLRKPQNLLFLAPEVQWTSKFTVFVRFTFPLNVSNHAHIWYVRWPQ